MARHPRPWYRKSRKTWFVVIDGKQVNLGPEKEAAFRLFHQLKGRPRPVREAVEGEFLETLAVRFVEWATQHRSPQTARWYKERIESFLQHAGDIVDGGPKT